MRVSSARVCVGRASRLSASPRGSYEKMLVRIRSSLGDLPPDILRGGAPAAATIHLLTLHTARAIKTGTRLTVEGRRQRRTRCWPC